MEDFLIMLLAHSGIPTEKQLIVIRIRNSIAEIAVLALSENGYIFNFFIAAFCLDFYRQGMFETK